MNGCEKYEFTTIFENLIKKCQNFFDVGANIGYFSILGSKINKDCKIYAFEPSVGPKYYLSENIRINHAYNVEAIEYAVADIKGRLTFHDVYNKNFSWLKHNLNGSHSLQNEFGTKRDSSYDVDVITLKKFKEEQILARVELIKLDTEYTEHIILTCSLELINEDKPIILCEVYEEIAEEMDKILIMMNGYKIYQIIGSKVFIVQNFKSLIDKDEHNFIFCHDDKIELIKEFI